MNKYVLWKDLLVDADILILLEVIDSVLYWMKSIHSSELDIADNTTQSYGQFHNAGLQEAASALQKKNSSYRIGETQYSIR